MPSARLYGMRGGGNLWAKDTCEKRGLSVKVYNNLVIRDVTSCLKMFSLETSAVNLTVEWKLFAVLRNVSRASLPRIHFRCMSHINLSHENGFSLTVDYTEHLILKNRTWYNKIITRHQ